MRIISLLPSATEIVCALGLEEDLIAITHECDFPPSVAGKPVITSSRISHETMTSREIDHAVRLQLDWHGSIYDLDVKLLDELQPDLILTQELCDVCAVSYKTVTKAAKMYSAGSHVVSLEPTTLEDILDTLSIVGDLTNTNGKANEVIRELRNRLDAVRDRVPEDRGKPSVFMLEWLEPPFAPGHWVPQQVAIAGGIPLLGKPGEKSLTTTYREIFESNPDVIVMIPCGYYIGDTLRQLENTNFPSEWKTLPAFENDGIWALDATSYFSRPGPRVVDGVEILAKIFHPDIFGSPSENEAVRIPRDLLRFS